MKEQEITFRLPFLGTWYTFWGGDTPEQNRHHASVTERYAFDFLVLDENMRTHSGDGSRNEQYYAFGQQVVAPADGTVMEVVDGVRDNEPGDTNPYVLPGNHVIIQHADGVYSFIAHLRKGSLKVREGQVIKAGAPVGECGNSGNSSEPHLHFHLQDSFVYGRFNQEGERQTVAQGIKAYFGDVEIKDENGVRIESLYSPVKGNFISRAS